MTIAAKPFIPWVGGKEKLQKTIRSVFPPGIKRYAEHFGGSGAMLLGAPPMPGCMEVYNDYDSDLVNLFLCVRDSAVQLIDMLGYLPIQSEAEFEFLKKMLMMNATDQSDKSEEFELIEECFDEAQQQELRKVLTGRAELWDVQRAAAFYKVCRFSFSGTRKSFGVKPVKLSRFFHQIKAAAARLEGVVITNRDFAESILLNDKPGTLHYCDPPYYDAEDKYNVAFGEEDHQRLHDVLADCDGHVVVSYNYCPFICELYRDFYIMYFKRQNPLSQNKGSVYEEVVITSYDPRPVIEFNLSQMTLFAPEDEPQEEGKLVLINNPKNHK